MSKSAIHQPTTVARVTLYFSSTSSQSLSKLGLSISVVFGVGTFEAMDRYHKIEKPKPESPNSFPQSSMAVNGSDCLFADERCDMELDETDPAVWLKLEAAIDEYIQNNSLTFKNVCETLLQNLHDERLSKRGNENFYLRREFNGIVP
ncbi:unnamed protein product [Ilex paraguariensis]|uniref:Uncharacterized protein n=1 Tax=Ilex paraguariensis TaxID=185542 RepID=A0ABC8SZE6_9AQUA